MGLFSKAQIDAINASAAKSLEAIQAAKPKVSTKSISNELAEISERVQNYFKDSPAVLCTSKQQLHDYITACIKYGYAGIDFETTGVDRIKDHLVGGSLYVPGQPEIYFPMKHIIPIFEQPYKNQLTYEEVAEELQRLVDNKVKLIFANADFDIAMCYHDLKVKLELVAYYDVILAWRCLKENEPDNALKVLYAKYVKKGKVDPMKFSDFFPPSLFPYCKPEIAALYAANDAKITFDLFLWQLPYVTKTDPKCQKHHLEKIADLIWNIEFPMIAVCANLHRVGMYLEPAVSRALQDRWAQTMLDERAKLAEMVDKLIEEKDVPVNSKRPFQSGKDFNPNSNKHVPYLVNNLLGLNLEKANKNTLEEHKNIPAVKQLLKIRSLKTVISTFVDKLPEIRGTDGRIHGTYKSVGADTGRMCIAEGTPITVLNGTKPIEDIKPGDLVYCYDSEGVLQLKPVVNLWQTGQNVDCVRVKWQSSGSGDIGELICTPEHRILKKDGTWCKADELERDDELVSLQQSDGHSITLNPAVQSVTLAGKYDVYDIEVETYHNFIASEICVHNSSADPNLQNIPSHATDIRHQFRATPETEEKVEFDGREIKLFQADQIQISDAQGFNFKYVKDIKVGDILYEGTLKVTELSELDDDGCIILHFDEVSESIMHRKITVRHPSYIMMSSDYSQQEPKLTAYCAQCPSLIKNFQDGKDIYATIASVAFGVPYEECLEFNPITHAQQPEGKKRRSAGKILVLGINYGMSEQSIAHDLFGADETMTEEQKLKDAKRIYAAAMSGFPELRDAITNAQVKARKLGYTETMTGRRRHHPNMQLPKFEFEPMKGYVNPDIDPLDPSTLDNKDKIPKRIVAQLEKEFNGLKYYGQIVKRTKELAEEKIRVINNTYKIEEASRQVFNAIIQGSAADLTKMAMIKLTRNPNWKQIGGRFLNPVHDELICEVPAVFIEEGKQVLKDSMEGAGSFLPFPIRCDIESTYRWYGIGIEDIAEFDKPSTFNKDEMTESNIKWLQCMLNECEYILPTHPTKDGKKPEGVAARGVDGIWSTEMDDAIASWMSKTGNTPDTFIDAIERRVIRGVA